MYGIPTPILTLWGAARGRTATIGQTTVGVARLPTDPMGSTVITLTNLVVGSRFRVERLADGSVATPTGNAEGIVGSSIAPITLDYYESGSANNDVRIKVRKGTGSPSYKPYETQALLGVAPQSIFIAQGQD
jgi:hypothetical protein